MDTEVKKFKKLIETSNNILVTSHISPDPDAVCSTLLLGNALKTNFAAKQVLMVLEEEPARAIDFLEGYRSIEFRPLLEATGELKPDLFIILDSPNLERCSRNDSAKLRQLLSGMNTPIVIIDHHEEHGKDESAVYINNRRPATAQEVYELLFEQLNLNQPAGYAPTALLGIISDTARHKFDNPVHRATFRVVSDLLDAGASIEQLEARMNRYDSYQLTVLNNLLSHITDSKHGYTYSFIDDDFSRKWLQQNRPVSSFKLGVEEFTSNFLRNFENNFWGFAVYKEMVGDDGVYGVSFRSLSGTKDVSKIAYKLGGGGHKPAAGAKFPANNIEEALEKVKQAISGALNED